MRILILGAGAVGLTVAAKLSAHAEVYAVCRKRYADAIAANGFVMTGIWGEGTYHFPCGESAPAGPWDYIIISTKSAATREVCERYRHLFGDAEVVSLQNGIGNEEVIREYTRHVIGAMIITGFEWRAENAVHVSVDGGETVFGRFPDGSDAAVRTLADLFSSSGMRSCVSSAVRSAVWSKALYSCSLNPLGAVMECPYGDLLRVPAWNIITEIVREAFAVSKAEGVELPQKSAEEYLEFLRNEKIPPTAGHYSSMYQDIAGGRMTEVDYINGAIVRLGAKHGIATPVNRTIVNLTHFKEELR
ncbi:ketopantoate reductase family protein [Methanocorpusculum vombati]|uniref:2-dehydropantoate 2-reductase n=1 Tax=Methanocorpusculum vombati TaxID=3002864 RepID=A0ABT4IK74_9EURY|nr:ketopantoate reductase family protein [Methanocorpusculum vombati]MCZ9319418.1 ketopantoate reductase family protein [Methanocorpusculum sp.]MCZ0862148.1 ketopantoate reductase family protein [Methanocorpusculum vombati]MDE2521122.1 ketopantoate reductase family protein [Methanocorpusculum sp.]MDE2534771.1 ketopantoate reductase family protein [Methanocorpusculum sp.]MDE2546380.1 ketopantoate reductase family protein [Methanocorpusculum sp.]